MYLIGPVTFLMGLMGKVTQLLAPVRMLHCVQLQVVMVDKVTRRPTPIEDKWRNLYQHHCVRGEPLIIQRQDVPDSGPLSVYEVSRIGLEPPRPDFKLRYPAPSC